jgi:hypothetical protein
MQQNSMINILGEIQTTNLHVQEIYTENSAPSELSHEVPKKRICSGSAFEPETEMATRSLQILNRKTKYIKR